MYSSLTVMNNYRYRYTPTYITTRLQCYIPDCIVNTGPGREQISTVAGQQAQIQSAKALARSRDNAVNLNETPAAPLVVFFVSGALVGEEVVGLLVGCREGALVGKRVGSVGLLVGTLLGILVGRSVWPAGVGGVGTRVGCLVGSVVGDQVLRRTAAHLTNVDCKAIPTVGPYWGVREASWGVITFQAELAKAGVTWTNKQSATARVALSLSTKELHLSAEN